VLPDLPKTEFEKSGRLELARADIAKGRRRFWPDSFLSAFVGLSATNRNGASEYRIWTIEQLALATTYLLGPDEPLLAAEVSVFDVVDAWSRNLAVVVTAAHVLVFQFDSLEGQPRQIAMAARAIDVKIEARTGLFGRFWPALEVSHGYPQWTILGFEGEKLDPEPVLDAWRQAVKNTR
jgi:hypothetical protein